MLGKNEKEKKREREYKGERESESKVILRKWSLPQRMVGNNGPLIF